ncbi:composite domain of metallo-dependent hydrolase [Leucogyrophana mollusca]|uniref:Composite domain of metallo-dependent hydrolase n=1 Tax=Leucogyrophana mollusca TaxID=85980 RepID=A0ACB8BXT5_9AGAM|nr:composite domain of metallo-dependent hydrolase [Leucogyrophana mollusca]
MSQDCDMEKRLPIHNARLRVTKTRTKRLRPTFALLVIGILYLAVEFSTLILGPRRSTSRLPLHAQEALAKCHALNIKPGPPVGFNSRSESDRFQHGTKPVLIRNASIWTGRLNGLEVHKGDLFLENGLIKAVGDVDPSLLERYDSKDITIADAKGAWVTPGIVDVHSHIAVGASPSLAGANDGNSNKGLALPWLRSLDGLNTHDDSYAHSIAGGVTTSLILPGSANAIGGQAFAIKLRSTPERSPSSLLVEPPFGLNGSEADYTVPPRWRHMKHACGENPSRMYDGTRMDTVWAYREAYDKARQIKNKQDEYCSKALVGDWNNLGSFPEELQWEALVDILRGKVKVQTHCYEAVDFDAFVRLSNEFQFPVAAFHHAHEAYLVPEVLKRAYEHPPAVAIFAAFSRYKREAYRHSEFAARILNDHDLKVVMKSDHPAIQSRYLLHEAQQAHYYGLPENIALASVTSNAAEVLGLEHRIGYVKAGYDADLVIWDSHPLALGATPVQVIIDGIPQLDAPYTSPKPESQVAPVTPNFDQEARTTVEHGGLPPLQAAQSLSGRVIFRNISSVWARDARGVNMVFRTESQSDEGIAVVENGKILCSGLMTSTSCSSYVSSGDGHTINLHGGSLAPALISTGSSIGLQEIAMEATTTDGAVYDPFEHTSPAILGGEGSIIRAVDGLQFGTRDALLAYRAGVTTSITPPIFEGLLGGLSTYLSLSSRHKLESGAIIQEVTAVHVAVGHGRGSPSISTQIAALRRLLVGPHEGERGKWFKAVYEGNIPLVVEAKNADIIATLLNLKKEIEVASGAQMKMTLVRAAEAHLLAKEIAAANVGVIVTPPRSFPFTWEGRRILYGPPLTADSLVSVLVSHNVTVGIGPQGVEEENPMAGWAVRNLRWDAAWVSLDSRGAIGMGDALAMASSNIETLLGVQSEPAYGDLVATSGGELLSFEGKVVAIISPRLASVDIF